MRLDRTKDPTIERLDGGIRVTIHLEGEEGAAWMRDYNDAAVAKGIAARAAVKYTPPWGITVTITDPRNAEDALRLAVEALDDANAAWSARNNSVPKMESVTMEWWRQEQAK